MPFPFSASGTVRLQLPKCDSEKLAERLTAFLQRETVSQIQRDGQSLSFKTKFWAQFLEHSWNQSLAPVTSGQFQFCVKSGFQTVRYQLRFTRMVCVATAMVLGFIGPVICLNSSTFTFPAMPLSVMWLWIVGGNYLICILRFPSVLAIAAEGRERK